MSKYKTPLFEPSIGKEEKINVLDCISSNWIGSKGKYIEKFEKKFSSYVKSRHAITVNNGTAALHLSLLALDIKKGDEVIVPTFTYIAPVNAIKYVGADVVFVDSKLETCQLDESKLQEVISKKTKALILPHLYGQIAEIEKIKKFCDRKKIYLIEDSAEAYGCFYKRKHVGTFGVIGTFSFFGNIQFFKSFTFFFQFCSEWTIISSIYIQILFNITKMRSFIFSKDQNRNTKQNYNNHIIE